MTKLDQQFDESVPHQQVSPRTPLLLRALVPQNLATASSDGEIEEITRQLVETYGETIMREALEVHPLHAQAVFNGAISTLCTVELFMRAQARKRN